MKIDFSLNELNIVPQARSRAYWADQLSRVMNNRKADYTKTTFAKFCDLMRIHFNDNAVNPIPNYVVPQPASCDDSLTVLRNLLTFKCAEQGEPFLKRIARADLVALMLNVVSSKISQAEIISKDGRTVSQAITFCDLLINDIDCRIGEVPADFLAEYDHAGPHRPYIKAMFVAGLINVGVMLPAGAIPEDIIDIRYAEQKSEIPSSFELHQNYPNPFNPATEIRFSLPVPADVNLEIYNVRGERVLALFNGSLGAGEHTVRWDGRNAEGRSVASGIYYCRISAGDWTGVRKMVLLR